MEKLGEERERGLLSIQGFFFLQVNKGQSEDGSPLTPFDLLIQEVILDKKIITQHSAMASPHLQ